MPTNPNPCTRDCPDRRPGSRAAPSCHADCPRRAAWLAEEALRKEARRQARIPELYEMRRRSKNHSSTVQLLQRRRERTRR